MLKIIRLRLWKVGKKFLNTVVFFFDRESITILSYKHVWTAAQLECGRSWLELPFDVCWFYFTFGTTMNF
jgi:hypothetical protein